MTPARAWLTVRGAMVVAAVTGALIAGALWQDQGSLERGNRLYRSGEREAALDVYERVIESGSEPENALYNLGTTLLPVDPSRADSLLARAAETGAGITARASHYNLGVRALLAASGTQEPDSMRVLLFDAVEHTRLALRLDPSSPDARWNLALAEQRLQEIFEGMDQADRRDAEMDDEEFMVDDPSLTRSEEAEGVSGQEPEEPRAAERIGERQGAREGAREAWASQDPGPMGASEALGLLDRNSDDPETLLRGLLWSHRPDVAWWDDQPYPGGQW